MQQAIRTQAPRTRILPPATMAITQPLADRNMVEWAPLHIPTIGPTHYLVTTAMAQDGSTVKHRALLDLSIGLGLTHHLVATVTAQSLMLMDRNAAERAPLHLPTGLSLGHLRVMMAMIQLWQPLVGGNSVEQALQHLPIGLAHHRRHHQIESLSKHHKFAPEFLSVASRRHRTMKMLSSVVFSKQCLSTKHISLLIMRTLHKSCSTNR
jgi:hypothetical protein